MGELRVEYQERNAPEVVTMQVGDDDRVQVLGFDPKAAQGGHRGRTAVEQHVALGGTDREARLEAPPAAEGITRSNELDAQPDLLPLLCGCAV